MKNFRFLEDLFFIAPVNFQRQSFTKVTRKHLCQALFFDKNASFWPAASEIKGFQQIYFLVNLSNLLDQLIYRTPMDDSY